MGRLATYRYYNMDQVVAQALTVFAQMAGLTRAEAIELEYEPKLTTVTFPLNLNGNGMRRLKRRRQAACRLPEATAFPVPVMTDASSPRRCPRGPAPPWA